MKPRASRLSLRAIEYLLSIFKRSKDKGYARQYEIIEDLGISKPTASLMVKKLRDIGYLEVREERIRLSRRGEKLVLELIWKHGVIESALVELGLSLKCACRIAWRIIQEIPVEDVKQIWIRLGLPRSCPCGHLIPLLDEEASAEEVEPCVAFKPGQARE